MSNRREAPDLSRFVSAHNEDYQRALAEIRNGRKQSHWIWYIFPQLKGLGRSSLSDCYGICGLSEARAFLEHPVLGAHLVEISEALLALAADDATVVMGWPDDLKLKSSMTLFDAATTDVDVFRRVLEKFFDGEPDRRTLDMLGASPPNMQQIDF